MIKLLSWINVVLICCIIALAFVIKDTREMVYENDYRNYSTLIATFNNIEVIDSRFVEPVYLKYKYQCQAWTKAGLSKSEFCQRPEYNNIVE